MHALEIQYQYRDASNYKQAGAVVISNPDGLTPSQLHTQLLRYFSHCQLWGDIFHFQPEAFGWPVLYFEDRSEDDLELHE